MKPPPPPLVVSLTENRQIHQMFRMITSLYCYADYACSSLCDSLPGQPHSETVKRNRISRSPKSLFISERYPFSRRDVPGNFGVPRFPQKRSDVKSTWSFFSEGFKEILRRVFWNAIKRRGDTDRSNPRAAKNISWCVWPRIFKTCLCEKNCSLTHLLSR